MSGGPILSAAILIVSLTGLAAPFVDRASREASQGERLYQARDWKEAGEHYQRAREARPDGRLDYNWGATAYQSGQFAEALKAYEQAARSRDLDRGRLAYDLGGARLRSGDLAGALAAYRTALREHPEDEDARFNYELALREAQKAPPEPQQDSRSQKGGDSQEKSEQGSSGGADSSSASRDTSGTGQGGAEGTRPPGASETGSQREQASGAAEDPENRMTTQEAERLLGGVIPEERELLRARLKPTKRRRVEKDW